MKKINYFCMVAFVIVNTMTNGMDANAHKLIKLYPNRHSEPTAFYGTENLRKKWKISSDDPFISCVIQNPFISRITFDTRKEEIKALKPMWSEKEIKRYVKEEQQEKVLIPLSFLQGKKHGEVVLFHRMGRLVVNNTKRNKFDAYVNECVKNFRSNPNFFVREHARIEEIEEREEMQIHFVDPKIIRIENNTIAHSINGRQTRDKLVMPIAPYKKKLLSNN